MHKYILIYLLIGTIITYILEYINIKYSLHTKNKKNIKYYDKFNNVISREKYIELYGNIIRKNNKFSFGFRLFMIITWPTSVIKYIKIIFLYYKTK